MAEATVARKAAGPARVASRLDGSRGLDPGRVVVLGVLYGVCIYLGRLATQPETGLALFWPATGIAVLWALTARTSADLSACLAAVFVLASVGNGASDFSWGHGVLLGVANVVMALAPRVVVQPPPAGSRGRWRVRDWPGVVSVSTLGRLVLAVAVGAALSGGLGMGVIGISGRDPGWLPWFGWITRNGAAALVIALPFLTWPTLSDGHAGDRRVAGRGLWTGLWSGRRAELLALLVLTGIVEWWVFGPGGDLPLTFLPFALVAWAGLRFPPPVAGLLGSLLALLTLSLVQTTAGGPFGAIDDPGSRAFTLQAFMVLAVLLAVVVALVISERDLLAARVAGSERQAREQAADLETITDTLPIGLLVVDRAGTTLRSNEAAQRLLGGPSKDAFEQRGGEFRRLDGRPVEPRRRPSALALEGNAVHDVRLMSTDPRTGADRIWSFTAAPLLGPDGETPDRALVLLRDVTDEHRRTTQLENFAGVVAHDLQNPMTAIEGWADVLAELLDEPEHDPAAARRALEHVQRAAGRGTQLIRDLLDYSVARTSRLHPAPVDLDRLVAQLADALQAADPGRGTSVDRSGLGTITADPVLMRQLFGNLIGNAVKYTPPDRAPLVAVGAGLDGPWVELTVTDNGVGVPPEQRSRIFEAFHRAHDDDPRFSGTGLGLAICARAVERHGGTLQVADNPDGPGTRFTVRLPSETWSPHRPSSVA